MFFLMARRSLGSRSNSTAGVKGSIGYIALEYGTGNPASIKGDVFSYGVLLLEIFSGKGRPTDPMFTGASGLDSFVGTALSADRVFEITDPRICPRQTDDEARLEAQKCCLISAFRIGLSCLKSSPSERPDLVIMLARRLICEECVSVVRGGCWAEFLTLRAGNR
ncbi:putative receptor-like protein kinase [Platanthera guangdongensis]|uniref:Receptor-like protein kinase n=1 Tax=Platanthera guangdongensis TaxID=2320717 RepID=A0ABR2LGE6_9ASPA